MPIVRRIRKRGATITVEAYAEVLFMPGGQVHNWTNRFTGRIRSATIAVAPVNKRPRWGHYGKPLKDTIVSARPRFWSNGRDKMRVYAAAGATAPHAYYVDQGTGVYAGNGPYEAKVIPPWQRGSASLYERTWRPGGPDSARVAPVMIRGQRGQFFFAKGLERAMQSMRLRSFQVPNEPKISEMINTAATGLENFIGNTPNDAGFRASLKEWRLWRDEAWHNDKFLGKSGGTRTRTQAKHAHAAHQAFLRKNRSNLRAFLKSRAASDARKRAQIATALKRKKAKELGEKRAAEEAAKAAEKFATRSAQRRGIAFGKAQVAKGLKDVHGAWQVDSLGHIEGYKVSWVSKGGATQSKEFPV